MVSSVPVSIPQLGAAAPMQASPRAATAKPKLSVDKVRSHQEGSILTSKRSNGAQASSRKSKPSARKHVGGAASKQGREAPALGTVSEEGVNTSASAPDAAAAAARVSSAAAPGGDDGGGGDLASENNRLKAQVEQLTLDLAVAMLELKGANARVEEAEEDQAAAETALLTERSRQLDRQTAAGDGHDNVDTLKSSIRRLETELARSSAEVGEQRGVISSCQAELSVARETASKLQQELATARAEAVALRSQLLGEQANQATVGKAPSGGLVDLV